MKRIILIVLIALSVTSLFAQVPEKVQATFKAKYPTATAVTWTAGNGQYVAMFTDAGVQNTAVLDADARVIRTEVMMKPAEYPATVSKYYSQKYPDEKTYQVWVVTDANGNKTYYIPSEKRGVKYYFDKTGNFVREEKMKAKEEMKEHAD